MHWLENERGCVTGGGFVLNILRPDGDRQLRFSAGLSSLSLYKQWKFIPALDLEYINTKFCFLAIEAYFSYLSRTEGNIIYLHRATLERSMKIY